MPTQLHLPAQPVGAQEINTVVAIVRERGDVAYFASGVPIFMHREDDRVAGRVVAAQLMTLGLARQDELSEALAVDRSTLYRRQRKLEAHGIVGVVDAKRGPRGPHRFTAEKASAHRGDLDPAGGRAGGRDRGHDSPCDPTR